MTDEPERRKPGRQVHPVVDEVFDIAGSDPELLSSGRIPDPRPEHTPLFRWLARVLGTLEEFLRARGGVSLRMSIRVFWGVIAAIGIFLLIGPVVNKPLDFDDIIAGAKLENVDWVARDAKIDYAVSRADDGTFQTTVREEFNANFVNGPESSVKRRIVTEVHGNDTEFELHGATIDGLPAEVTVTRNPTTTDIRLKHADGAKFSGTQTVTVEYELHHLVEQSTDEATGKAVDEWSWPLFAPTWPQATKGIEVSVTLAHDVNDALVRSPKATVGWLLAVANKWLSVDGETAEGVRYAFNNDDTLPPNADVWVLATFKPGTFAQPEKTTLFCVQTYGPLIPLVLLAITTLFALAARRVVWADSAGEPWYVVRSEPPAKLTPELAAQLLGRRRHAELVRALAQSPKSPWAKLATERQEKRRGRMRSARKVRGDETLRGQKQREAWVKSVAQAGKRAGKPGNLPSVLGSALRWNSSDELLKNKLRWIPDSYVRDTFIAAPLALTVLQWGILRQLSHQVVLLVVWWPVVFVLVTTALALLTLWAVHRPRPLTRSGALALQQLKGIGVYARSTQLVHRGPLDDPLMPYAVLFVPPREAGAAVTELATRESGDRSIASGWRTKHFLSIPALLGLLAAIAVLTGSIITSSTQPAPYASDEYLTWPSSDFRGTVRTQLVGFEVEAELTRDADGAARLTAVERQQVGFDPGGSVPQYAREWQHHRFGQDLGFAIESVRLDGEEIPFRTVTASHTTAMVTELTEVVSDMHEVEISYALETPVTEVAGEKGEMLQQLRWAALLEIWEDTYYEDFEIMSGNAKNVRPLRVQLAIAPEIAAEVRSGGWIDDSHSGRDAPFERGDGFVPWEREQSAALHDFEHPDVTSKYFNLRIGSEAVRDDGTLVVTFDADEIESQPDAGYREPATEPFVADPELNAGFNVYDLGISDDIGVVLNFAPGTFSNVTEGAYDRDRVERAVPIVVLSTLTLGVIIAATAVAFRSLTRRQPLGASQLLTSYGTLTLLAIAQTVLFWWVTGTATEDGIIIPQIVFGLIMWAAVGGQWFAVAYAADHPSSSRSTSPGEASGVGMQSTKD